MKLATIKSLNHY